MVQIEETRRGHKNRASGLGLKIRWPVGLVTVGFGQDGPGVAMPKGDFRAGILGSEGWEPPPGGIQVLETLQFEVPTVCVPDQNVVSGV